MGDTNKDRQKAVREAWKNERGYVRGGNGTRDWSQTEQREIVAKGRANGFEGHHMKSVKEYPQYASDPKNIQFLSRSEHVNGAHKGSTQNATNGCYNPKTGETQGFGNSGPQAPQSQSLSAPLTQKQQDLAVKREQARQQAAKQARIETKQTVSKATTKPAETSQSTNKGIASFQSKASGQSSGASGGKSEGSSSAGQSNSGQSSGRSKGQSR